MDNATEQPPAFPSSIINPMPSFHGSHPWSIATKTHQKPSEGSSIPT